MKRVRSGCGTRPAAIETGRALFVVTGGRRIVAETEQLLRDPAAYHQRAQTTSPLGAGQPAERTVAVLPEG